MICGFRFSWTHTNQRCYDLVVEDDVVIAQRRSRTAWTADVYSWVASDQYQYSHYFVILRLLQCHYNPLLQPTTNPLQLTTTHTHTNSLCIVHYTHYLSIHSNSTAARQRLSGFEEIKYMGLLSKGIWPMQCWSGKDWMERRTRQRLQFHHHELFSGSMPRR